MLRVRGVRRQLVQRRDVAERLGALVLRAAMARRLALADPEQPAPHRRVRLGGPLRIEDREPTLDAAAHLLLHVLHVTCGDLEAQERPAEEDTMMVEDLLQTELGERVHARALGAADGRPLTLSAPGPGKKYPEMDSTRILCLEQRESRG